MYTAFGNILIEVPPKWYPYYVICVIEMKWVKCDVAVDTSYIVTWGLTCASSYSNEII